MQGQLGVQSGVHKDKCARAAGSSTWWPTSTGIWLPMQVFCGKESRVASSAKHPRSFSVQAFLLPGPPLFLLILWVLTVTFDKFLFCLKASQSLVSIVWKAPWLVQWGSDTIWGTFSKDNWPLSGKWTERGISLGPVRNRNCTRYFRYKGFNINNCFHRH